MNDVMTAAAARTMVVTGVGARGQVGEAVARAAAAAGYRTAMIGLLQADLDARRDEMRRDGLVVDAFACDLTDPAATREVAATIGRAFDSRLDALIHTAGGFGATGDIAAAELRGWHTQFAINATTAFVTTGAFLPMLRAARGAIVYFASAAALPGGRVEGLAAYAAAKSAVVALTRTVAADEKATGVRANALAPTAIRTATNTATMDPKTRYVEMSEVIDAAFFLCSPAAGAVSGQVIALA